MKDEQKKDADRLRASENIMDRAWGKSVQQVNGKIDTGVKPIDTANLPKEQRDALAMLAVSNMALDGSEPDDDQS